jgi:hypothetical protein
VEAATIAATAQTLVTETSPANRASTAVGLEGSDLLNLVEFIGLMCHYASLSGEAKRLASRLRFLLRVLQSRRAQ